jgi:Putative Flp pilus-assembly TadE/G-like
MTTIMGRLLSRVSAPLAVFARAESGAAAVYVAIVIPAFVGAGGLAVDVASWYSTQRTMQSGADAAAYAAALELARQGLDQAPDLTAMQAAADDAASRNGVGTTVTLNIPPLSGLAAGDAQAVEIIVTEPAPVHFAGMFLNAAPVITTRAVAKAVVSDACIWALHPSAAAALSVAGSAQLDLDCGVVVNSDHEQAAVQQTGNSCLHATSVSVHGGYSGSCVTPEPEVFTPSYGDPLSYLTAPTYGGCDFPTKVTVDAAMANQYGGGPVPLVPGVYCGGIEIKANQTAVFGSGLYVLKGGEFYIAGNATVSNTEDASGGVTFYLTGTGTNYATLRFESGANITLTPMTTGPLANVLFYQDPNAPASGSNRIAGGVTMHLTGIIYFPNQHVEFTGGSTTDEADILLVASTLAFTGDTYLNSDYAQSLLPEQYYARFVE